MYAYAYVLRVCASLVGLKMNIISEPALVDVHNRYNLAGVVEISVKDSGAGMYLSLLCNLK
jgi:hypothetical protein